MIPRSIPLPLLSLGAALTALPASAQDVFTNGVTIYDSDASSAALYVNDESVLQDQTCIGFSCIRTETFDNVYTLKLKWSRPGIEFIDSSTDNGILPFRDWRLEVNSAQSFSSGGMEYFAVKDLTENTTPFTIEGGAPQNAFWLDETGDIGLGTMFPQADLHLTDSGGDPGIRFEDTGFSPYSWYLSGNSAGFYIYDVETFNIPFEVRSGAPENGFFMTATGNVGLGTNTPEGKLHTKGDGVQLAYFESGDGDAVQVRFRTDSENRRFLAVDNADNVKTQMQFRDDAILFLGQTVAQEWLRVSAGGITTAGPSCASPCDAVFDPEAFTIPPLKERAAYMWEQQHLPAIGATAPGQPMNITEKMGGVIHELELAHIYIEQLHDRLEEQDAQNLQMMERLATLEAKLGKTD